MVLKRAAQTHRGLPGVAATQSQLLTTIDSPVPLLCRDRARSFRAFSPAPVTRYPNASRLYGHKARSIYLRREFI